MGGGARALTLPLCARGTAAAARCGLRAACQPPVGAAAAKHLSPNLVAPLADS